MSTKNSYKIIDEREEASRNAKYWYTVGFFLSIALTLIPYLVVTKHLLKPNHTVLAISLLAFAQLFVQVAFFLHLHKHTRPHWNMIVFFFTILIVAFLVIGTLWIMYHLNMNMMGISPFNSNEGYIPQ